MKRYNIEWGTPSKNAAGTMPIGNGDIAANVYVIENGDLYLLLSKNDAYTYQGDLFKTGRVKISVAPNPFLAGQPFRQTLDLETGSIHIDTAGVSIRIWADANYPVYHVEIDSAAELKITAQPEFWTRFDHCGFNNTETYSSGVVGQQFPAQTQDHLVSSDNSLIWYYAVGDRTIVPDDLKYYEVEHMAPTVVDPFRFNTFGNLLESPQMKLQGKKLAGTGKRFDIRIHARTEQTPEPKNWIDQIQKQASRSIDVAADWQAHENWWKAFWNRSWIIASDRSVAEEAREHLQSEAGPDGIRHDRDGAALVSQAYNVFRFLMAAQSRGRVQTKFNGGLFTQQLLLRENFELFKKEPRLGATAQPDGTFLTHEDDRSWGRRFTYQNQRLLYWPLLASGDFDLLQPFFDYYWQVLPVRRAITKAWFGHDGAYFRENVEPDGAERDCGKDGRPPKNRPSKDYEGFYHDFYFTSGLETVAMMLDYVNFAGDARFRDQVLAPFAREVLLFYDLHYPRNAQGKLRIEPSQVLETWWDAVDPSPDIAGLAFCLDGLIAGTVGTADDEMRWKRFRAEIPPVPLRQIEGKTAISPGASFKNRKNDENGELYPVFPFRCFGVGLGSADIVEWTLRHRTCPDSNDGGCWSQDQIQWAYAGNAKEAAAGLVRRFRTASTQCRFPLFGRELPDSCPDFDHFGSGATAIQAMLVQEANGKIFLLPAWPASWDVDFKLHLSGKTVISGTVTDGRLANWEISPESRRGDVVVGKPQE
jgi:hypothetical protein